MTLQEFIGIELPIVQAPMAGVQLSALAIAVSEAGGLGSLPCAMLAPGALRKEPAAIPAATTRPVNVDFFVHAKPELDARRAGARRAALAPYAGADVVIAQGLEAGGHRGMFLDDDLTTQLGTFALLPQILGAVKLPVIAAGGIADAKGVAAALALGAAGVQVGTSYLLCQESTTSAVHRAALKSEAARHTALTNVFTGRPARGIVNRLMREVGPMSSQAPAFPLAVGAVAPLRARAESAGSGDFSPMWAGQNPTGCREIPAGRLTRELAGA